MITKFESGGENKSIDQEKETQAFESKKADEYLKKVGSFCEQQAKNIAKMAITETSIAGDSNLGSGLRMVVKKLKNIAGPVGDSAGSGQFDGISNKKYLYKILEDLTSVGADLNEIVDRHSSEKAKQPLGEVLSRFEDSLRNNFNVSKIQVEKGYKIDYSNNPDIFGTRETDWEEENQTISDVLREGYRFKDDLLGGRVIKSPVVEVCKYKKRE